MERAHLTSRRRISFSIISASLAVVITAVCFSLAGVAGTSDRIDGVFILIMYSSPFCVAGWLIALPIILNVRRIDGWRLWVLVVLGSGIGPFIMFSIGLFF